MTIESAVAEALRSLLGDHAGLTSASSPIETFGLASIDGIEFAVLLEDKLGWALPPDANPFVDDTKKRARTVGEIVAWMNSLAATGGP
ncbi:MAG TPA: acyl carrier protein [Kofleriaceae bacterium]|jgi:acyl carrier protein